MRPLPAKCLGFLEFIGTTELLVVLFVALVVFGPRKLPELGRSLGRALNQVRAAADDFKRTWEVEALTANDASASEGRAAAPAEVRPASEAAGARHEDCDPPVADSKLPGTRRAGPVPQNRPRPGEVSRNPLTSPARS